MLDLNDGDTFALMGYICMAPILGAIIWAWWMDTREDRSPAGAEDAEGGSAIEGILPSEVVETEDHPQVL